MKYPGVKSWEEWRSIISRRGNPISHWRLSISYVISTDASPRTFSSTSQRQQINRSNTRPTDSLQAFCGLSFASLHILPSIITRLLHGASWASCRSWSMVHLFGFCIYTIGSIMYTIGSIYVGVPQYIVVYIRYEYNMLWGVTLMDIWWIQKPEHSTAFLHGMFGFFYAIGLHKACINAA